MNKETLVAALNEDLAGELQAVTMYVAYAAAVTGPHRPMLRQFFTAEIPDELAHAQFLADKVASLGGEPTTVARMVPKAATAKQMLENVLAAEQKAMADYKVRAEQAAAYGDKGLATHLETIVEDETGHYEETEKILRGW